MRLDHLLSGKVVFNFLRPHLSAVFDNSKHVERESGERRDAMAWPDAQGSMQADGLALQQRMRGSVAQLVRAPS